MDNRLSVLVSGGSGALGSAVCRELAAASVRPIVGYHAINQMPK